MSSNKTPLGLNNWSPDDKPVRVEFNKDNEIIDQKLRDLESKKANLTGATFTGGVAGRSLTVINETPYSTLHLKQHDNDNVAAVVSDANQRAVFFRIFDKPNDNSSYTDLRFYKNRFLSLNNSGNGESNVDLGRSNYRWNNIYAKTSIINTSDAREKEDVVSLDAAQMLAFLKALNPVRYKLINGTSGRPHYGLIAQEVEQAMALCGMEDFAGLIKSPVEDEAGNPTGEVAYGLRYDEFVAVLLKVAQHQAQALQEAGQRLEQVEQRLAAAGL